MGQNCFKDKYEDVTFERRENEYSTLEIPSRRVPEDGNGDEDYCEIADISLEVPDQDTVKTAFQPEKQFRLVVAAIDFGTTYSGWGYALQDDFLTDPSKVTVKHWNSGNMLSYKAPTCILLAPDGDSVEAFGYDAETSYAALVQAGKHKDYYYYSRFKMELHKSIEQGIKRDFELTDATGKCLKARKVFALSIKWLKEDLALEWKTRLPGTIKDADVHWMLTVPAIWSEAAKQFMRKAAQEAGIKAENLTIVLEPEVASVLCRHMTAKEDTENFFRDGLKYLILDAGGGTVDITVHQVVGETGLKEIASASGGNWGGTKVDAAFADFIKVLVGNDVYRKFSTNHRDDFIELFRTFEIKKRLVDADSEADITFSLPLSLMDLYHDATGTHLSDTLQTDGVCMFKNKLRCKAAVFRGLFQQPCDSITKHITKVLDDISNVSAIMMVGGFSESAILQDTIKRCFPHLKVIVPRDTSLCVLKGAVMFGHDPYIISERVMRYTYGTSVFKIFEEGIDPGSKKIMKERGPVCKDVFSKHVQKTQVVKAGESQTQKCYRPLKSTQSRMCLPLFASEFCNPRYITDSGCTQIGSVWLDMPDKTGGLKRDVLVSFTFSGTEINVTAVDTTSGNVSNVVVDLLS